MIVLNAVVLQCYDKCHFDFVKNYSLIFRSTNKTFNFLKTAFYCNAIQGHCDRMNMVSIETIIKE